LGVGPRSPTATAAASAPGFSEAALTDLDQVRDFPDRLPTIQVDDDGTTIRHLGRPALRARVRTAGRTIDVISVHLKSKLLTFPGSRFKHDEDERAR
jgi:hypothetical protein